MLAAERDFRCFLTAVLNVSIVIWVYAENVAFGLISLPKTKSPVGGVKLAIMKGKTQKNLWFLDSSNIHIRKKNFFSHSWLGKFWKVKLHSFISSSFSHKRITFWLLLFTVPVLLHFFCDTKILAYLTFCLSSQNVFFCFLLCSLGG